MCVVLIVHRVWLSDTEVPEKRNLGWRKPSLLHARQEERGKKKQGNPNYTPPYTLPPLGKKENRRECVWFKEVNLNSIQKKKAARS